MHALVKVMAERLWHNVDREQYAGITSVRPLHFRCGLGVATSLTCLQPKGLRTLSSSLLAFQNCTINTRPCGRRAVYCGQEGML